jgi:hypothetical protein
MVPPLERSAALQNGAAIEVLGKLGIGVSAIQFDHQWEDIDVEA